LLRVAAGRALPTSGEIWLGNEELRRATGKVRAELRRSIGYGGSDTPLLGGVSLLDNVTLPEIARGKRPIEATAQAFHVLSLVDLASRAGEDVARLEPAERRLALVARACVGHPRLVVLDEPTEGLTDEDSARVLHTLRSRLDRGAAVLVASCDESFLRSVEGLAGRIVRMEDGRILPGGGAAGLVMTSPDEAPRLASVRVEVVA
jgi:ABC-type ATPase involved in cell division